MRFEIEPGDGPADEAPSVRVIDGPAESEITITAVGTDIEGHRWQSRNVFRSEAAVAVDLSRDAPVSGSYGFVDPSGPIWSMRFASEDVTPSMFAAPRDQLDLSFTVETDGLEMTTEAATRRWSAPGVTGSEVKGDGFVGCLFEPAGPGPHPAVSVIPGSAGPQAMEPTATLLASRGYVAMVVGYMGLKGLPATLCEVPLENLADGIRRRAAHPNVDDDRVGVLCASVGTEGALAALTEIDDLDVRALVAISPSSVI